MGEILEHGNYKYKIPNKARLTLVFHPPVTHISILGTPLYSHRGTFLAVGSQETFSTNLDRPQEIEMLEPYL